MEKSIQRKLNLDLLRILATIAVAGIHVSTLHYYDFDPRSLDGFPLTFMMPLPDGAFLFL